MSVKKAIVALMTGTAALGVAGHASAQQASQTTAAGTSISNTASVSYTVNGTAQSTTSTTATFVVDRKVNFTVETAQVGLTQVNLSQQNAVTTFKVTNLTNDAQDFLLDPDQQNVALGIFPGTDNFDMTNLRVFVDSNGNGVYDPNDDTQTYVDELAPDASATVFVVANVPNDSNADIAYDSLHVIVAAGGSAGVKGSALVPTPLNLANADNTVDVVFADGDSDGLYPGDIVRNGQGRAYSGYQIGTRNVALTVAKSAKILSDPVNLLANPKSIPGAVVEYCLRVNNATLGTGADGVTLSDIVPARTTYVPGSISVGTPGVLGVSCVVNGSTEDDDADDTAESDGATANYNTSANTVTARLDRVAGGASAAVSFKVTID